MQVPSGALKVKNAVLMPGFVGRNHGLILNSDEVFKGWRKLRLGIEITSLRISKQF